ncbi:class 1 fructose-bisphosphatase [Methylovorus sp. SPW-M1]
MMNAMTLHDFLQHEQQQGHLPDAEFTDLLQSIAESCRQIARAVNRGALTGNMGSLDSENIQGETQKELDVITNTIFLEHNQRSGHFAGMASEEMELPYEIPAEYGNAGKYLLLFDPLDGSSNVNLNAPVGTIFSILSHHGKASPQMADFLQAGDAQVCAGYALYGTSTMLVLTTGFGTHGFTLDEEKQHFVLTHHAMQIPADTQEFAINMSRQKLWDAPVKRYISECLQGMEGPLGKTFNMRWMAAMVAEVHRLLIRGGIFIYPTDRELRDKGGKLRLMYEANPMSFLVEQAGGLSTTGDQRMMEVQPGSLHQRVPVIMGARHEVMRLQAYHQPTADA